MDGGDGVEVDVVVAYPEEVEGFFVDAAGYVVLDLEFGAGGAPGWFVEFVVVEVGGVVAGEIGEGDCVVDCGAEVAAAPGVAEGEILGHGYVEEIGEVGDGDWAVGPGGCAVDFVVGLAGHGDVVGNATIAVIREVISEGDEGGEFAGGCWGCG